MKSNIPITKSQVKDLPIGFTETATTSNRSARRSDFQKERFHGESKNHHLIVGKFGKFVKRRQFITIGNAVKIIEHYDSSN